MMRLIGNSDCTPAKEANGNQTRHLLLIVGTPPNGGRNRHSVVMAAPGLDPGVVPAIHVFPGRFRIPHRAKCDGIHITSRILCEDGNPGIVPGMVPKTGC